MAERLRWIEGGPERLGEAEFDSLEEVDAVARSVRRVAIEYCLAVVVALLSVPVMSAAFSWWFARPVWGGMTLNFIAATFLLHAVFIAVGVAYTRYAERIEDDMLGRPDDHADATGVERPGTGG